MDAKHANTGVCLAVNLTGKTSNFIIPRPSSTILGVVIEEVRTTFATRNFFDLIKFSLLEAKTEISAGE